MRPLGRNVERYHEAVHGMTDLVKAADELGFWGVSTIEHHFHSEGYEVGPSPGMLNAYWAAVTKNVRVGQLGYTMSAQNPIRVAEETAILDHLTSGRCFVGFSRGYQARWTNVLGQHLGTRATLSPAGRTEEDRAAMDQAQLAAQDKDDRTNRDIFEEQIDLVLESWGADSLERPAGGRWEIPYPYDQGIEWGMKDATAAPRRARRDRRRRPRAPRQRRPGAVQRPAPAGVRRLQREQGDRRVLRRQGLRPHVLLGHRAGRQVRPGLRRARAAPAGRDFALGQNQALVRWMQIADSEEAARRAIADYDAEIYVNLYKALTPVMPLDPADTVQSVVDCGLWMYGTPEMVRDQFVAQWQELPAEYVVLIFHYAQMPADARHPQHGAVHGARQARARRAHRVRAGGRAGLAAMARKQRKAIISCAVTGAIHVPSLTPHLPITPEQIAEQAIGAAEAGAAILHLHARHPETGRPTPDPDVFGRFLPAIHEGTDAVSTSRPAAAWDVARRPARGRARGSARSCAR